MNRDTRSELFLIGITLIWGSTFIVIQQGLALIPPFLLVFLRFSLAALGILPLMLTCGRKEGARTVSRFSPDLLRHGVILGALLFVSYAAQTFGLISTTVSKSAFITYSFAIFTPPLQFLLTGKRLKAGNLLGLVIVITGMFIFTRPEAGLVVTGDVLTLLCAVAFAFYVVFLDIYGGRHEALPLSLAQFVVVALLSAVFLPFQKLSAGAFTPRLALGILYLAIPATLVTLFLQTRHQPRVTPSRAAVIFALEPVFASVLSLILTGRFPAAHEYSGATLILAGLLISELRLQRTSRIQHLR